MSSVQKTALSLLIAVIVFTAFTVAAFSGLFEYIEATFYDQRMTEVVERRLATASDLIEEQHNQQLQRFEAILEEPAVRTTWRVNQSEADIAAREQFFGRLRQELPAFSFVRFVDNEGERLWYSSLSSDIREQDDTMREYEPLSELEDGEKIRELVLPQDRDAGVYALQEANQLVYQLRAYDTFDIARGTALFYTSADQLNSRLVRRAVIGIGDTVRVGPDQTVIVNAPEQYAEAVSEGFGEVRQELDVNRGRYPRIRTEDQAYLAFERPLELGGIAVWLEPESSFEMTDFMRGTLLAAVFLTTFLVVFLLLNLRQDAVVVLSDRVKRFQINLLREYLDSKEQIDWKRWQHEIENRKQEVNREIKRGIGSLKPEKEAEVDALLDKSWEEILSVIGSRSQTQQKDVGGVDLERLERIIERVVANTQHLPAATMQGPATDPAQGAAPPVSQPQPVEREQVAAAESAEAELGEPVEVEELEELDEAEDAAEVEELEEADELDEAEEPEELEELEEVSETEEAAELDEVGELEEADEDAGGPDEPAAAETGAESEADEDLEELEEPEDLEEAAEPEELEELAEAEEFEEEAEPAPATGAGTDSAVGERPAAPPPEPEAALQGERSAGEDDLAALLRQVHEDWEKAAGHDQAARDALSQYAGAPGAPAAVGEHAGGSGAAAVRDNASDQDRTPRKDFGISGQLEAYDEEPEELEELEEAEDLEHAELQGPDDSRKTGRDEELEELESWEGDLEEVSPADPEDVASEPSELEDLDEMPTLFGVRSLFQVPGFGDAWAEPSQAQSSAEDVVRHAGQQQSHEENGDAAWPAGEHVTGADTAAEELQPPEPEESESVNPEKTGGEALSEAELTDEYEAAPVTSLVSVTQGRYEIVESRSGVPQIRVVKDDDQPSESSAESPIAPEEPLYPDDGFDSNKVAGVESLFGAALGEFEDLGQRDSSNVPQIRRSQAAQQRSKRIVFGENGVDYDRFLEGYKRGEGGVLKSLMEFSRIWNARVAAILVEAEGGYRLEYAIGIEFENPDPTGQIIPHDSRISQLLRRGRRAVLVKKPFEEYPELVQVFGRDSVSFRGRFAFLPIQFKERPAYFFLGLRTPVESLQELVNGADLGIAAAAARDDSVGSRVV